MFKVQSPVQTSVLGAVVVASGLLGASIVEKAEAAGFEILRPHRAVYEVELKQAEERSGISNMSGRIVYEMQGNECDGMSVQYRFVAKISANGDMFTTDMQTSSFEAPDGGEYSFVTKSFVNDQLEKTVQGVADKEKDAVTVNLVSPKERVLQLPQANFISTHLVRVIEKAREGVPFFKMDVFDGGDNADEILKTTNIIGKPTKVDEVLPGEDAKSVELLKKEQAWPVNIAYFKNTVINSTEPLPVYEVAFLLYEGGVSRKLVMSYPDYSITGTLVSLEYLDKQACTIRN